MLRAALKVSCGNRNTEYPKQIKSMAFRLCSPVQTYVILLRVRKGGTREAPRGERDIKLSSVKF